MTPNDDADVQRVRELLPWFALGRLDADDHAFVQPWLQRGGRLPADVEAEIEWLCSTEWLARDAVARAAAEPQRVALAEDGLARLQAHIAADRVASAAPPQLVPARAAPSFERLRQRLHHWLAPAFAVRGPALAYGLAALLLVQAALLGGWWPLPAGEQAPLSGGDVSPGPGRAVLTIAFKPQAGEPAIRELLLGNEARIVAGPSALGLYCVSVPALGAEAARAAFGAASAIVESAQPGC